MAVSYEAGTSGARAIRGKTTQAEENIIMEEVWNSIIVSLLLNEWPINLVTKKMTAMKTIVE